jgi:hypothetical protein
VRWFDDVCGERHVLTDGGTVRGVGDEIYSTVFSGAARGLQLSLSLSLLTEIVARHTLVKNLGVWVVEKITALVGLEPTSDF